MIVTITEFYVRGDLYIALEWMGVEENEFWPQFSVDFPFYLCCIDCHWVGKKFFLINVFDISQDKSFWNALPYYYSFFPV